MSAHDYLPLSALPDLDDVLDDIEAYLENRQDADCDQGGFIPNEEMRLLGDLLAARHKARVLASRGAAQ